MEIKPKEKKKQLFVHTALLHLTECNRIFYNTFLSIADVIHTVICFISATGIFTTDVIRKQAADLWEQMSERAKKDYTKEFYDALVNNMIKYSTVGVSVFYD